MEFSKELREDVISGDITLTFRLWQRPRVKAANRYPVGPAEVEIDSIELVAFGSVSELDVEQAGERDLESLRRRTAHSGPIDDETMVYRIEFHIVD